MDDAAFALPRNVKFEDCLFYHTVDIPNHGVVRGQWDLRQGGRHYRHAASIASIATIHRSSRIPHCQWATWWPPPRNIDPTVFADMREPFNPRYSGDWGRIDTGSNP
jgi:hypothetical protein